MAASLVGGAAVGAVFGELLNAVLETRDKAIMFKQTLANLRSTLLTIAPTIQEIEQQNIDLGRPKEELESLIREMEEGTNLVSKCSKIHRLNFKARARYQERLEALMDSLARFFTIDMQAHISRDQKETLFTVRRLLSLANRFLVVNAEDPSDSSSYFSAVSVLGDADMDDEEINYSEEAMEHISQITSESDHAPIDVSESDSENTEETNSAEQPMEPLTSIADEVSEVSSLLGRAGKAGLSKAVEVLDTLGSSMTNLNLSSGFISGVSRVTTKGNKILILAFEVAKTIVKGANLMQSLSKENIRHLKEVVLPSEGVQNLISRDMDELLRIAAADKREELKIFCGGVVRFRNLCKDPQRRNLNRFFEKLGSELTPQKQLKYKAEMVMQQLMTFVQYTTELYHELHALEFYWRKLEEEDNSNGTQRGDSLAILRAELKSQKKHVRNLKKKSLWSKTFDEVMEKLQDILLFIYLETHEAFGSAALPLYCSCTPELRALDTDKQVKDSQGNHKKLGSAGLALHYANVITQIDTLVSRSSSVPPNTRDALYQGLPRNVKSVLRSRLQSFQVEEELTVPQIKAEMEKTLQWLVPIAANTRKAHHGFGLVEEWVNSGSDVNRRPAGQTDLLRIKTLHHADKDKTEGYILELVIWLHHLVRQVRVGNGGIRSPVSTSPMLTIEDQQMLRDVGKRKLTPGINKSQEFDTAKNRFFSFFGSTAKNRLSKHHRLSKSSSHSPINESKNDIFSTRLPSVPVIDFDIDRVKALDVIDGVETIGSSLSKSRGNAI